MSVENLKRNSLMQLRFHTYALSSFTVHFTFLEGNCYVTFLLNVRSVHFRRQLDIISRGTIFNKVSGSNTD